MTTLSDDIRREVVDLHDFFTMWFNGTAKRDQLEHQLLSRLHPDFTFIPPEGAVLTREHLTDGFQQSHGSNKDFRIQIRDVTVRHQMGNHVLATYTEWQTGAAMSERSNNARFSTALIEVGPPITWLHLQETWLPEAVRAAGPFDF